MNKGYWDANLSIKLFLIEQNLKTVRIVVEEETTSRSRKQTAEFFFKLCVKLCVTQRSIFFLPNKKITV